MAVEQERKSDSQIIPRVRKRNRRPRTAGTPSRRCDRSSTSQTRAVRLARSVVSAAPLSSWEQVEQRLVSI